MCWLSQDKPGSETSGSSSVSQSAYRSGDL